VRYTTLPTLAGAYDAIEQIYVVGDHLEWWLQSLTNIRKTLSRFDTADVSQSFGNFSVDYEQVQIKDQHEILMV